MTCPSASTRSSAAASKCSAGELEDFGAHILGRFIDGVAGHDRSTAGKGAGAPVKLVGIPGDNVDIGHVNPDLVGDDLGEDGEMALPLGADPGGDETRPLLCT